MAESSLSSALHEGTIIIDIGPEHKKYYVHKALLGPWKEAEEGVVRLEDVDHRVMNLFVEWHYTSNLPTEEADWCGVLQVDINSYWNHLRFTVLLKAYVFGDRFLVKSFRRQVNNTFVHHIGLGWFSLPTRYEGFSYAFANIPSDRPILQLLVDEHCGEWDKGDENDDTKLSAFNNLPPKFLIRAFRRIHEMTEKELDRENWCYCEHESDKDKTDCETQHMRYDERLDFGTFE
ncbi:hypothetical protein BKA63DRAFT_484941 [Paraphoma chrysanthemicola]|nr:hypothetical protein BKA63DRAFT_484941 [Paraphoma chrysanthemicola]